MFTYLFGNLSNYTRNSRSSGCGTNLTQEVNSEKIDAVLESNNKNINHGVIKTITMFTAKSALISFALNKPWFLPIYTLKSVYYYFALLIKRNYSDPKLYTPKISMVNSQEENHDINDNGTRNDCTTASPYEKNESIKDEYIYNDQQREDKMIPYRFPLKSDFVYLLKEKIILLIHNVSYVELLKKSGKLGCILISSLPFGYLYFNRNGLNNGIGDYVNNDHPILIPLDD